MSTTRKRGQRDIEEDTGEVEILDCQPSAKKSTAVPKIRKKKVGNFENDNDCSNSILNCNDSSSNLNSSFSAVDIFPVALVDHILTGELISDPVVAEDNITYDRTSIEQWFKSRTDNELPIVSPQTREQIGTSIRPNTDMKREIDELVERRNQQALVVGNNRSSTSTAVVTQPEEHISLHELNRYFEFLDPCRKTLDIALNGWCPPSVIAVGTESSGKSSIIERITMMSLFPQSNKICTRVAIHVRLRRSPQVTPPELEVFDTEEKVTVRKRIVPLSTGHIDVKEEMDKIIYETAGSRTISGINSRYILILHINSPRVPSIDLVDLPGIVAGSTSGEPDDMPKQTLKMAESYITKHKENGIFLAVCCATHNTNADVAFALIQRQKIEEKTLGVVTMCDKLYTLKKGRAVFDAAKLIDKLGPDGLGDGSNITLSPYGYVCVINRDSADGDDDEEVVEEEGEEAHQKRIANSDNDAMAVVSVHNQKRDSYSLLEKQVEYERRGFNVPEMQRLSSENRVGIQSLITRLSSMYSDYLNCTWMPKTFYLIQQALRRNTSENASLGLPECSSKSAENKSAVVEAIAINKIPLFLQEMSNASQSIAKSLLSSHQFTTSYVTVACESYLNSYTAILDIKKRFLEVFRNTVEDMRCCWVNSFKETLLADSSPTKLGRFPVLLNSLFPIVEKSCFDKVFQNISIEVNSVVDHLFECPSELVSPTFSSADANLKVCVDSKKIVTTCAYIICVKSLIEIESCLATVVWDAIDGLWVTTNSEIEICVTQRKKLAEERFNLEHALQQNRAVMNLGSNVLLTDRDIMCRYLGINAARIGSHNILDRIIEFVFEGHKFFPINAETYLDTHFEPIEGADTIILTLLDGSEVSFPCSLTSANNAPTGFRKSGTQSYFTKHQVLSLPGITTHCIPAACVPSSLRQSDSIENMLNRCACVSVTATITYVTNCKNKLRKTVDVSEIIKRLLLNGCLYFPCSYFDYDIDIVLCTIETLKIQLDGWKSPISVESRCERDYYSAIDVFNMKVVRHNSPNRRAWK